MARLSTLRLARAHLADLPRPPWKLGLLLVADALDLAGTAAFASMSPPPDVVPRGPFPLLDVPHVAAPLTMGVAALGFTLAVLMTVEIAVELFWLYRRSQLVFTRRRRINASAVSGASRAQHEALSPASRMR